MNGKELLNKIGLSRKQSNDLGPLLDEELKKVNEVKKLKKKKVVTESDITEPLNSYKKRGK